MHHSDHNTLWIFYKGSYAVPPIPNLLVTLENVCLENLVDYASRWLNDSTPRTQVELVAKYALSLYLHCLLRIMQFIRWIYGILAVISVPLHSDSLAALSAIRRSSLRQRRKIALEAQRRERLEMEGEEGGTGKEAPLPASHTSVAALNVILVVIEDFFGQR